MRDRNRRVRDRDRDRDRVRDREDGMTDNIALIIHTYPHHTSLHSPHTHTQHTLTHHSPTPDQGQAYASIAAAGNCANAYVAASLTSSTPTARCIDLSVYLSCLTGALTDVDPSTAAVFMNGWRQANQSLVAVGINCADIQIADPRVETIGGSIKLTSAVDVIVETSRFVVCVCVYV